MTFLSASPYSSPMDTQTESPPTNSDYVPYSQASPSFRDLYAIRFSSSQFRLSSLIIGLVSLFIAGWGGVWAGSHWTQKNSPPPTIASTPTPTPDPTNGWQSYTYEPYSYAFVKTKFSLKMPPGMINGQFYCDQRNCWSLSVKLPTGALFTVMQGGKNSFFQLPLWSGIPALTKANATITTTEKTIDSVKGMYVVIPSGSFTPFEDGAPLSKREGVILPLDNDGWLSIYIHKFTPTGLADVVTPEELQLFDQMLLTVQFNRPTTKTAYTCPPTEWVNCMPSPDGVNPNCTPAYLSWAQKNCSGFKGAAY